MPQDRPEQGFGHGAVPGFVGMAEIIARRRGGPAQRPQGSRPQFEGVAHVVQTERVGQLGVEQRHDVAPGREAARLFVHPVLARQLRHQVCGNEFDELPQDACFTLVRAGGFLFFHTCLLAASSLPSEPLFLRAMGWLWTSYTSSNGQPSNAVTTHENLNDALTTWVANCGSVQYRSGGSSDLTDDNEPEDRPTQLGWLEHCEGGFVTASGYWLNDVSSLAQHAEEDGEMLTAQTVADYLTK
jgi:hypothetical protein